MNLYAETSAVVAWLLDEERGDHARSQLAAADAIHTSDLTLIECDRTLRRATLTGRLSAAESSRLHAIIDTASAHWTLYGMDAEVMYRSRRSFPFEPIRPLDSIHLATPLSVRNLSPDVLVLSFDDRIRANAAALGFRVEPHSSMQPWGCDSTAPQEPFSYSSLSSWRRYWADTLAISSPLGSNWNTSRESQPSYPISLRARSGTLKS